MCPEYREREYAARRLRRQSDPGWRDAQNSTHRLQRQSNPERWESEKARKNARRRETRADPARYAAELAKNQEYRAKAAADPIFREKLRLKLTAREEIKAAKAIARKAKEAARTAAQEEKRQAARVVREAKIAAALAAPKIAKASKPRVSNAGQLREAAAIAQKVRDREQIAEELAARRKREINKKRNEYYRDWERKVASFTMPNDWD